ncbi:Abscisic acid G-protein coupled receptor-domain-containing protein [Lineolata rhizophorae]|uniref:Abscisic acid G-protein coupled receptor-domain-containing protein n=1 Tax=Lineolata rhizophorae TaxID=578093 RepID=A0A6A6P1Y0_9PEZI|nr:Abscisic acid G-protein coupled receptor-domain-containing protein [Lineolata rhizophorae]
MVPSDNVCDDDCIPAYVMQRRLPVVLFSSLPFILTFLIVATAVSQKLFPLLSGQQSRKDHNDQLPSHNFSFQQSRSPSQRLLRPSAKSLAAVTFSANIALSAVLVELILCEISNTLNPVARSVAFKFTLMSLLFLLILAAPALEIQSVISAAGWTFSGSGRRLRAAWVLETLGLVCWLVAFWYLGRGFLGQYLHEESYVRDHSFSEGCLERIAVIGIALMASLAGFAAVSALWQTFGAKQRPVTETDVTRKHAGLDATTEMLQIKRSRLRALRRKMSEAPPPEGFVVRMMNTFRTNADAQELRALELEVSGLETMQTSLSHSLLSLQSRRSSQLRARTPLGRVLTIFSYIFASYCLYRIIATSIATVRRMSAPSASFAASDPINNILALLAKHWDPTIDRAAWSRQISFLLSGVMLLLSFNSVLQTFLLFARLVPGVLRHAHANLALIVSQISATYVISSALLLRSNLPQEVGSVISGALEAPLEPRFVEAWFEGWFLAVSGLTAVGIWIGRKVRGSGWDDEDDGLLDDDIEIGKRN